MLRSGRLPHALLFAGPRDAGKLDAARALAATLCCAEPAEPGDACGRCTPCHKIAEGIHPDVLHLAPQGAGNVIAISEMRDLAGRLGFTPHEGKARVVILEHADRLTTEAANAFLKTLEEPPARTHFVLLTSAPERLPSTIHSRCQTVLFAAVRGAADAGGEAMDKRRARVRRLAAAARGESVMAAVQAASELAGDKEEIAPTLDLLGLWYRDAAALAAGAPPSLLMHAEADVPELASEAQGSSPGALARRAGAVLETQKALLGYANAQLALERLLIALRP